MGMKILRYKITKRFVEDSEGVKRDNPDCMIVILSGTWCSVKKRTIPIGTLHNQDFRRLTRIITYPSCDPRGEIRRSIDSHTYYTLIDFVKGA